MLPWSWVISIMGDSQALLLVSLRSSCFELFTCNVFEVFVLWTIWGLTVSHRRNCVSINCGRSWEHQMLRRTSSIGRSCWVTPAALQPSYAKQRWYKWDRGYQLCKCKWEWTKFNTDWIQSMHVHNNARKLATEPVQAQHDCNKTIQSTNSCYPSWRLSKRPWKRHWQNTRKITANYFHNNANLCLLSRKGGHPQANILHQGPQLSHTRDLAVIHNVHQWKNLPFI